MKKALSLVLVLVLLVGMMPTAAFAAGTPTVTMTADKTSVLPGETVTFTVTIDESMTNLSNFEFHLYFDDTLFTKTGSTVGGAFSDTVVGDKRTDKEGKTFLAISGLSTLGDPIALQAGTICTVTFTADESITEASSAAFELVHETVPDYDTFEEVPVNVVGNISVSVAPKTADPAYTVTMAEDATIVTGETVNVPVTVGYTTSDVTTFNAFDLSFTYDASILSLTSTEIQGCTVTTGEGTVRVQGYGEDKALGTAFTLTFQTIAAGTATVTLTSAKVDISSNAISGNAPEATILDNATVVTVSGYTVTLCEYFTGEATVGHGEDYTFTAKDTNYIYTITATMGGEPCEVIDNNDGTYTIKNVTGNLVIDATRQGKNFTVTVEGTGKDDVTAASTATYMTDYSFTLTPAENYSYEVTITIGGTAFTGFSVVDNVYTIGGENITGDIVITVTKTEVAAKTYTVTFTGSGAGDASGLATATHETEYRFRVEKATGYSYTISATVGDKEVTVHEIIPAAGVYAIAAADVTGNIVITIEKTSDATVEIFTYVELDGKTMFLVLVKGTTESGKVFAYNGSAMFYSEAYEAYCFLTIETGAFTVEDATALVTQIEATAVTVAKDNADVNESGLVDINDAQLVYDMYNGKYDSFETVTMLKFLKADLNGSKNLTVEDAAAVIAAIE